jgi:hypothetical protein
MAGSAVSVSSRSTIRFLIGFGGLGESQLETALPQMCSYGADVAHGANARVFGARIAVGPAALGATLGALCSTTSNRSLDDDVHLTSYHR